MALLYGRFGYGAISEEFDRSLIRRIETGEGNAFTELTSEDLLEHGDIEFRAWIALLGAIGARPSQFAVYEPFYRAIGGMAVASWSGRAVIEPQRNERDPRMKPRFTSITKHLAVLALPLLIATAGPAAAQDDWQAGAGPDLAKNAR